jgi:hypothetical protein
MGWAPGQLLGTHTIRTIGETSSNDLMTSTYQFIITKTCTSKRNSQVPRASDNRIQWDLGVQKGWPEGEHSEQGAQHSHSVSIKSRCKWSCHRLCERSNIPRCRDWTPSCPGERPVPWSGSGCSYLWWPSPLRRGTSLPNVHRPEPRPLSGK